MSALRWILLVLGLLLIVYLFWRGRRESARRGHDLESLERGSPDIALGDLDSALGVSEWDRESDLETERSSPALPSFGSVAGDAAGRGVRAAPPLEQEAEDADELASEQPQKIIALKLVPRENLLSGDQVFDALLAEGLEYGRFNIFHRYEHGSEPGREHAVFSVANLVEPGTFDLDELPGQRLPGLTIFMVLPGPQNAVDSLNEMLACGRTLASALHAELMDEQGCSLGRQTTEHLREEVLAFELALQRDRAGALGARR